MRNNESTLPGQLSTVRRGISEVLKYRGSPKIAEICNFRGTNVHGIDTKILAIQHVSSALYLHVAFFPCTGSLCLA